MEDLKPRRKNNCTWAIIWNENRIAKRNGWLRSFNAAFIAVGIIVIIIGTVSDSKNILDNFSNTTAALLNIDLYIIPLFALCIGSITISEENESGSLKLLLTYPVSMKNVIAGKYIGLMLSFLSAIGVSLGISILLMIIVGMYGSIKTYIVFSIAAILLMMVYLSIALLIGVLSRNRMQAIGVGISVWFISIIIYEPAVSILCLAVPGNYAVPIITASLLINPADLIRVLSIISMGSQSVLGTGMKGFIDFSSSTAGLLTFIMLFALYIILPIFVAYLLWRRVRHE